MDSFDNNKFIPLDLSLLDLSSKSTAHLEEENLNVPTTANDFLNLTTSPGADYEETGENNLNNAVESTEILVYCQNVNRMKSAIKMIQIQNNILSASYSVIMANETRWDETVRSEEAFGSRYNVYRDDRDLQSSNKRSGGGESRSWQIFIQRRS